MDDVASDPARAAVAKNMVGKRSIPSSSPRQRSKSNTPPAGSTTSAKSIPHRSASPDSSSSIPSLQQQGAICLEKISEEDSFINMAVQPNASAFYTPDGKIWLASVPASGSGGTLRTCARPFLDLEGQVLVLTSLAFHPDFATNRRFFVSYICDTIASPTCGSSAETGNKGSSPSQYRLVVAEFSDKAKGTRADPSEVRKLFTMDLPQTHTFNQQQAGGGQIMFGPSDGYLYLVTGHGGEQANRESSNDTSSLLGNIIRFNVDKGVTGQSAVGTSNPTANRSATVAATTDMGELDVFAVGLANPRGCSFDSEMPDYLYCANVDERRYESVLLFSRGGNYSGGPSVIIGNGGHPVSSTSSTLLPFLGGSVYRGSADPSLKGSYLYKDDDSVWAAVETAASSRHYAYAQISNISCSYSSQLPCHIDGGFGSRIVALGEDNSKNLILFATDGIYQLVEPRHCGAPPRPSLSPPGFLGIILTAIMGIGALIGFGQWLYRRVYGCYSDSSTRSGHQTTGGCNGCRISCCNCNNSTTVQVNGPSSGEGLGLGVV